MKKFIAIFLTLIAVCSLVLAAAACTSSDLNGTYSTIYCSDNNDSKEYSLTITLKEDDELELEFTASTLSAENYLISSTTEKFSGKWAEMSHMEGTSEIFMVVEFKINENPKRILQKIKPRTITATIYNGTAKINLFSYNYSSDQSNNLHDGSYVLRKN